MKVREEALQNELQVMRLSLLKINECHCNSNGSNKQSNGTTNDEMVKFNELMLAINKTFFSFRIMSQIHQHAHGKH